MCEQFFLNFTPFILVN